MKDVRHMTNTQTVENVDDKIGHTPKNPDAFMEDCIVVIIETQRSQNNRRYMMKRVDGIPSGKIPATDPSIKDPVQDPETEREGKGQQGILRVIDFPQR